MYELQSGIYKIISPSNRIYIGQAVDIERRLKEYKKLACKDQRRLYESLNKYGFENHVFEIQELCDETQLNIRERYWQDFYIVLSKKGLNCKLTEADNRSGKLSDETKRKISEGNKGKVRSEKVRQAMSKRNKGKKLSEETKQKIKEARKRQIILPRSEETKNKISKANKGSKHSEEVKKIISEKMKGVNKGRVFSDEHKKKLSEAAKNRKIKYG
jgi:group I intron endonuclease